MKQFIRHFGAYLLAGFCLAISGTAYADDVGAPAVAAGALKTENSKTIGQITTPAWKSDMNVPPVTPAQERALQAQKSIIVSKQNVYSPALTSSATPALRSVATGQSTLQSPVSIQALATSLKNDPDLIYQYVHDNIAFVPIYGVQKGGLGALIDGAGTPFDQADLMVQLLRAAGYTATYMKGEVYLTPAQFQSWYGVSVASACSTGNVPSEGRTPFFNYWSQSYCDAPMQAMQLTHVWVKVNIGGTFYVFDPSFKSHTDVAGLSAATMTTALGYNQSTFLSNARSGATITADYAQNLNRNGVRANLATYSTNLVAYLRANRPAARLEDVVGGRRINPTTGVIRQATLPYQLSGSTPEEWTDIPNSYRNTFEIQYQGIDQTFFSDQLSGKRLTVFYTASNVPELRLDGVLVASGTAPAVGANTPITMTVAHLAYSDTGGNVSATKNLVAAPDRSYAIANSWGPVGKGAIQFHRRRAIAAKVGGAADASESVRGEVLTLVGRAWTAQQVRMTEIECQLAGTVLQWHHTFGIAGQSLTPFVDYAGSYWTFPTKSYNPSGDFNGFVAGVIAHSGHGSMFENLDVQENAGVNAVSTTKIIDIAVSLGQKIFDATSANYSANVRPNLLSYSAGDLNFVDTKISNGWRVITPEYGNVHEDQFSGSGIHTELIGDGTILTEEYIVGGLSGGLGTTAAQVVPSPLVTAYTVPASAIDTFRGNYQYQNSDISLSQPNNPSALAFQRQYSSGEASNDGPLGLGWSHNLVGKATVSTDSFQGMGDDSGIDAASAISEIFVTDDILRNPSTTNISLDRQVIAKVAHRWFGDQMLNNVVAVKNGDSGQLFVKLADGTYNAPQGDASRLTLNAGLYSVETSQGAKAAFGIDGNITSVVQPNGLTLTYAYTSGKLTSVNNGVGRVLTLNYTGTRISSVTDGTGRSVTYTYDAAGNLTQFHDPLTNLYKYNYDQPGRLYQVFKPTQPSTAILTNSYDNEGRMTAQTDINGKVWSYYSAGTRFESRDPLTNGTIVYLDEFGNQTKLIDPLGKTTLFEYDGHNRLTRQVAPELNESRYTYDNRHNQLTVRMIGKPGSGLTDIISSSVFPATCVTNFKTCNKPTATIDAKSHQTDYTYNAATGYAATITSPAAATGGIRPQTRLGYIAIGAITIPNTVSVCQTTASCTGVADEIKTTTVYNANLLPTSVTKASGTGAVTSTTAYTYDAVGNQLTIDGPLAGTADTTRTRYNLVRQIVGEVSPDPDGAGVRIPTAKRYTYNADGLATLLETGTVVDQTDGAWTSFSSLQQLATTYGIDGRATRQDLKGGGTTFAVTQTNYDSLGRVKCKAIRMDPTQWGTQTDACAAQTTSANGADRITFTVYDAKSRVAQVQAAYGTVDVAFEQTNFYSNNGKQTGVKDGQLNLTTYVYDGFDRLSKTRYPSPTQGAGTSSTTDYEQFTYDADSNITQHRLRDAQLINFTYDNLDRPTLKDLPSPETDVSYAYDLLGRTLTATGASGAQTLAYDALNRTLSETQPFGSMTWQYDAAGRRTRATWNDGYYVTYDYDVGNNVTAIRETGAASGIGVLATYAYDNLGRRVSVTRGNTTTTSYAFDAISRLTSLTQDLAGTANDLTVGTITYNPASQIVSQVRSNDTYAWNGHYNVNRNYTLNGLNQDTAAGTTSLAYDARGDLTTSGTNTYAYTAENRLKTATGGVSAYYDALGRLIEYDTSVSTRFLYDGSHMAAEIANPGGAVLRRYIWGPGADELLVWYEGSGTTDRRWLHQDERGSVIAVSDGTGAMSAINRYDEFGIPAATNIGRFQYTGQAWLPTLGMYYYKARIYSPTLGRFMQTDPIGYGDGLNWYNYVGSDPVNKSDSTGNGGFGSSYSTPQLSYDFGVNSYSTPQLSYDFGVNSYAPSQSYGGGSGFTDFTYNSGGNQLAFLDTSAVLKEAGSVLGDLGLRTLGTLGMALSLSGDTQQRIDLYRAVDPTELNYVETIGNYGFNPSNSGKYFGTSRAGVENLMQQPAYSNTTLTQTNIPTSVYYQGHNFYDPNGAGNSVHFSDPQLIQVYQTMTPIKVYPGR